MSLFIHNEAFVIADDHGSLSLMLLGDFFYLVFDRGVSRLGPSAVVPRVGLSNQIGVQDQLALPRVLSRPVSAQWLHSGD